MVARGGRGGSGAASGSAFGGGGGGSTASGQLALGVLTQSKASPRYQALAQTWLPQFEHVLVFESHTDVVRKSKSEAESL